jgi:formylglycine-generating enzyme required for sulfatase activity
VAPLCKIGGIAEHVKDSPPEASTSASIPIIPDHEVLRVIGRGAYGEIWLARSLTGAWRAVKVVYRTTFESERAFQREFQGMSAFEPVSRAHPGFIDILHVGRTRDYLYYIMELADDHTAGRKVIPESYVPRTLKGELDRQRRLSAADSIKLGISLTEGLQALHGHGLTHRDIKPSNIIFIDGVPKLADIGLVAATGQNSFVGTEGYVPPEGPGTAQADVYSLGKVIYEISTGKDRLDFPEVDSQLTARSDKEEALRLNEVLIRACAGDPRKRYESAAAMNHDLCRLAAGSRVKRPPIPIKAVVGVIVLALALAAGGFLWKRFSSAPVTAAPSLEATIESKPPGAWVVLDGHYEHTPATFKELEARRYPIRIMLPGYDPLEAAVDLGGGKNVDHRKFELTRSRGSLELDSTLAGVEYSAQSEDGSVSRKGTLPARLPNIPTGKYTLMAKHDDWSVTDAIEVKRGETLRKSFNFATAPVTIRSEPTGALVTINKRPSGKTPLEITLPARVHDIVAHLDGWPDQQQTVTIQTDQKNEFHFVFANGSVKVSSAPAGATVLADGRERGQTPCVIEDVKPGRVSFELRMAGYKTTSVTTQVEPQQQAFLAARLERSLSPEPGQPWTNSLGMKFVPVGTVRFAIWETRVQDYDAFCSATGRHREAPDFAQGPTHPVVKVNWFDAVAFCKWLTDKEHDENLLESNQSYRLPTDTEWSTAVGLKPEGGNTPEARDGKVRNEFPWGKQWPPPNGSGNYADRGAQRAKGGVIENFSDGFAQTAPAGSFKANALGLYDLGGNVWEWCLEGYKGDSTGTGRDWGVLRGGSWATSVRNECQSSYRNVVDRSERDVIYGFRCVLVENP